MTIGVAVARGALPEALSVSTVVPEVVSDAGLNEAATPGGRPAAVNVMGPENAPRAAAEIK